MKTITLAIDDEASTGDADALLQALGRVPGIHSVAVCLAKGRVRVELDEQRGDATQVHEAIRSAGYQVNDERRSSSGFWWAGRRAAQRNQVATGT